MYIKIEIMNLELETWNLTLSDYHQPTNHKRLIRIFIRISSSLFRLLSLLSWSSIAHPNYACFLCLYNINMFFFPIDAAESWPMKLMIRHGKILFATNKSIKQQAHLKNKSKETQPKRREGQAMGPNTSQTGPWALVRPICRWSAHHGTAHVAHRLSSPPTQFTQRSQTVTK